MLFRLLSRWFPRTFLLLAVCACAAFAEEVVAVSAVPVSAAVAAAEPVSVEGTAERKLPPKCDVNRIGQRSVGGMDLYTLRRERMMGEALAADIDRHTKEVSDPETIAYVNRLAARLWHNSDSEVPITIRVIDSQEINIFSLPGGFVYVTKGLILELDDEAELASLVAHEIAHIAARHVTRSLTRRYAWDALSMPLMYLGGPLGFGLQRLGGPLVLKKFNRDAEREADLLGMQYEFAAGYDPAAFIAALEKLQHVESWKRNAYSRIPVFRQFMKLPFHGAMMNAVSSQPEMAKRISTLQKEISEFLPSSEEYIVDTSEFDEAKDRLDGHPILRRGKPSEDSKEKKDRPALRIERTRIPGSLAMMP